VKFFLDESKKHGKNCSLINSSYFNDMSDNLNKPAEEYGTFHLTTVLIRRARELMNGAPTLTETDSSDPVKAAFDELASGHLNITGDVETEED
jgi:DNA-directed RNA polymerase subunit K/omega